MTKSLAERYRARFPPREHEEAVRMLLEGVEKQQVEELVNGARGKVSADEREKMSNFHQAKLNKQRKRQHPDNSSLVDRKSLNSSSTATETNSSSGIIESNGSSNELERLNAAAGMQSKSTSTSESISTGTEDLNERGSLLEQADACQRSTDLIPSRTIAVQCDLKSSSVKSRYNLFDTSMQASSISSTKYGFYSFNREQLARRHVMQRSSLYGAKQDGGLADLANGNKQHLSTEAPTSMSESSELEEARTSEDERTSQSQASKTKRASSSIANIPERSSSLAGSEQNFREPQRGSRPTANGRQVYASELDNSKSTARARIDSLPRRPMTAMSYISSNKLRDKLSSDTDISDQENGKSRMRGPRTGLSKSGRFNSRSQQNLDRPKTSAPETRYQSSSSLSSSSNVSSDNELARQSQPNRNRKSKMNNTPDHSTYDETKQRIDDDVDEDEDEGNRRSEEVILTNTNLRGTESIGKRPQLVEARHHEDVHDLNILLEQFRQAESDLRNNGYGCGTRGKFSTLRPGAFGSKTKTGHLSRQNSHLEAGKTAGSTMSLSRKTDRRSQEQTGDDISSREARRCRAQDSMSYRQDVREPSVGANSGERLAQVGRSISMRQPASKASLSRRLEQSGESLQNDREFDCHSQSSMKMQQSIRALARNRSQTMRSANGSARASALMSEDYPDGPLSKTWSNPAESSLSNRTNHLMTSPEATHLRYVADKENLSASAGRKGATRSMSMRDVNGSKRYAGGYTPYRSNASFTAKYNDECSSSDSSDVLANESVVRNLAARLSPLDYDSQQRLNESGLPKVETNSNRATSYLGTEDRHYPNHHASQDGLQHRYLSSSLNDRNGGHIRGRAMSQQSLTRPTMASSASGRRWQPTSGANSAKSHLGDSSMSLASRLQGRYESAHTRAPIVMYIPPASSSRASSLKGDDTLLRCSLKKGSRSPRNRSRHGSQDRSAMGLRRQRSTSRHASDSETSSIMKTLARARGSRAAESAYSSKRIARMQNIPVNNMIDTDEEQMDGVGRLATELDSYKFVRRYSVPKDAKINWFSRLRQRVSSANR